MFSIKPKRFLIYGLYFVLASFVVFSVSSYSIAQDIQHESASEITDISIEGNNAVSANTILSRISTKVGSRFMQRTVNDDIKRLYATGFFTDVIAEAEDYKGGIRLIFKVVEKSVVSSMAFEGNRIYRAELLKKQIETKQKTIKKTRII